MNVRVGVCALRGEGDDFRWPPVWLLRSTCYRLLRGLLRSPAARKTDQISAIQMWISREGNVQWKGQRFVPLSHRQQSWKNTVVGFMCLFKHQKQLTERETNGWPSNIEPDRTNRSDPSPHTCIKAFCHSLKCMLSSFPLPISFTLHLISINHDTNDLSRCHSGRTSPCQICYHCPSTTSRFACDNEPDVFTQDNHLRRLCFDWNPITRPQPGHDTHLCPLSGGCLCISSLIFLHLFFMIKWQIFTSPCTEGFTSHDSVLGFDSSSPHQSHRGPLFVSGLLARKMTKCWHWKGLVEIQQQT